MANQQHVKILKKGVRVWNKWRMRNPEIIPDLREADLGGAYLAEADLGKADVSEVDLSEANLSGANLRKANLGRANLRKANLDGAYLDGAYLGGASLSGANLRKVNLGGAYLGGAYLRKADLREADLGGADLIRADLIDANLAGADLADCVMGDTSIGDVDLSGVKGLETVEHVAPSSVGIDTIYRSQGNIPEVFLRGTGVPEPFIREMKALVNAMEPIQFYSCFISYSSKDQEFAERLYADLQQKNVPSWFAPEEIKIGDKFRQRIDEAIRVHDKLLLVLTENSVKSAWVEKEVETAFEKERKQGRTVLFPIRLDDVVMEAEQAWAADIRRSRHIGDFSAWKKHDKYKKAFERLMRDLKAEDSPNGKAHRSGNPNG